MRIFAGLAMIALVAACATGQGRSTEVDPVGAFDFTTSVDGSPVTGTITITRSGSEYGGSVSTGETFTGTWSYAGMEGSLTGRRRAG
jgi:hypothetical protein